MRFYCILFLFLLSGKLFAQELTGYVDMHAHPRGDLAYGTELFFGAPYGDISVALGNCKPDHGAWSARNKKGNLFRQVLAQQTEKQYCPTIKDSKQGYPDFTTWPTPASILHQQMWVDWIQRAHEGGLNIMCALAVSSHCIASAAKTSGPQDDEQVLLNCIQGIKDLVSHSTFMEIALTPADVRRIVTNGKLAVVLGTEMDNIGNFYSPQDHYKNATFNAAPSNEQVQSELDKLWDLGLRYIFPVHLTNNVFGSSAIALAPLNVANKFNTGAEFIPEKVNTKETGIGTHLVHPGVGLNAIAKMFMPFLLPKNVNPGKKKNYTFWDTVPGFGMRNSTGITERGRFAIKYMMQKGFLIDIDHMSEKMTDVVLSMALANDYPVNSGHNGLRGGNGSENGRTVKQYEALKQLGGMIGLGHGSSAGEFVNSYRQVAQIMGNTHMGIGTDAGGFYPLPARDTTAFVTYDSTFTRCKTGNRTWDINTDGVAHYGLMPDYIRSWDVAGMTAPEKKVFMSSAEDFTRMWEKCEARKTKVIR
ncbi:MAG: putative rane protein [Bacteroidota bacterium]|nr:putative rane protein [Bacteroidota bacterium]